MTSSLPNVGETLFRKSFPPISRHALALYCGASGDTNPIHVDSDFARRSGYPDVFAHGMLIMALLGRSLTEAVPPSSLVSYSVRFLSITQLHAELSCEGQVAEIFEPDGERHVRIDLLVRDERNDLKLRGEAIVRC